MKSLDPLLHHLHRIGAGSWSRFARVLELFDEGIEARMCARALSEHALVEFDFDGNMDWSVTSTQLVNTGRSVVVAWGGTPRGLDAYDIDIEFGSRRLWVGAQFFTYSAGNRVGCRKAWPRDLSPVRATDILEMVPYLSSIVSAGRAGDVPMRKAERLVVIPIERHNPGGFHFFELRGSWQASGGVSTNENTTWKLDRGTFMVTRNHYAHWAQQDVAMWTGFVGAADRIGMENLLWYDDEQARLHVAAYPYLPPVYVRALLLAGAREGTDRRRKRVFNNVDPATAEWLAARLGIQLR